MADFGKPDKTGRSSGRLTKAERKFRGPPKDQPWSWHSREMLLSPAWRALSVNGRRLLDFLELEHLAHAGRENGHLKATYDQLEEYGISRRLIPRTIGEVRPGGAP